MSDEAILVTGGAGYIAAHVTLALLERARRVVVLDNLSTGRRSLVPSGVEAFYQGDVADGPLVERLIADHGIGTVMHFAGSLVVPESVEKPLLYYRNNVGGSMALFEVAVKAGIEKVVFSSTASVYGAGYGEPVPEDAPTAPESPYGRSKLMVEQALNDAAAAGQLRPVILRYFNVAGADAAGRAGQVSPFASHLIRTACLCALGQVPTFTLNGHDYDTEDGTAVRDYIHVTDLAAAHVAALDYLDSGGAPLLVNCGYGRGYSVRQVVERVKAQSGVDFPVIEGPRRAGDIPELICDPSRILTILDWQPRHQDLDGMIRTALAWEQAQI